MTYLSFDFCQLSHNFIPKPYSSVYPKGWYHDAPPSFTFKVDTEKHCLNIVDQTSCTTDALPYLNIYPGGNTAYRHTRDKINGKDTSLLLLL